jgi:gluconokinase
MGVAGSGKSSVGEPLAERLGVDFGEADDFHPRRNIEKMSAGQALDDEDRKPWLEAIGDFLADHADTGVVVTCSALKRSYRDLLRTKAPAAVFLHLTGPEKLLAERMGSRKGHFMPTSLLGSQLETLEPLQPDELGYVADIAQPVEAIVKSFLEWLGTEDSQEVSDA